jgi:hypothetical protein
MAYMNQERKALLKTEIDKVMPRGWKYSLAVRHHSTLVLTIKEATVDLIGESLDTQTRYPVRPTRIDLNLYHLHLHYSGKTLKTITAIKDACNVGNHDRSDSQSDYFDVGWYVDINIGSDEKGFTYRKATRKRSVKRSAQPTYAELKARVAEMEAMIQSSGRAVRA